MEMSGSVRSNSKSATAARACRLVSRNRVSRGALSGTAILNSSASTSFAPSDNERSLGKRTAYCVGSAQHQIDKLSWLIAHEFAENQGRVVAIDLGTMGIGVDPLQLGAKGVAKGPQQISPSFKVPGVDR